MIKKEPPYTIVLSSPEREAMERIRALRRVRSWAEAIRQMIGENDPESRLSLEHLKGLNQALGSTAPRARGNEHTSPATESVAGVQFGVTPRKPGDLAKRPSGRKGRKP